MYNDLRNFISLLEQKGHLERVSKEVDWKYEIGKITRNSQTPVLFENIKDYPEYRIFTNGLRNYSQLALAVGLKPENPYRDIIRTCKQRFVSPVEPIMIEKGSIEYNFVDSDEIDLLKLPVPWWSDIDGGRYIGTWHINVTKDPETGLRNVGVYRMQILGSNQTTVSVSSKSHLAFHMNKAEKRDKPLEMAVAIGVNETVVMSAAAAFPQGTDEYHFAGGLEQKPIELIKCKTVNLEVPANSEFIIEGIIKPGIRVQDGPYLDYAGIPSINRNAFLFEVTGLMHRENPIFRGTSVGIPGGEDHILFSVLSQLNLVDFHGSRIRQKIQNFLLRRRYFKAFQLSGRVGKLIRRNNENANN